MQKKKGKEEEGLTLATLTAEWGPRQRIEQRKQRRIELAI